MSSKPSHHERLDAMKSISLYSPFKEPSNWAEEYGEEAMYATCCRGYEGIPGDEWIAPRPANENRTRATPCVERAEAERFLSLLDPTATGFTFQTFDDNKARKDASIAKRRDINAKRKAKGLEPWQSNPDSFAHVFNGPLDRHWKELCSLNSKGAGVFVTINETDGEGRKSENVERVRALFDDLDGAPLEPVLRSETPPHIVVQSSPGKFHAYRLVTGIKLDQFSALQQALAKRFGGDPKVCDLPRVMRLPGFVHHKTDPVLVRIVSTREATPYTAADFGLTQTTQNDAIAQHFEEAGKSESPTQRLNDAAIANYAAWVPEIFPTARPYRGDGFRVSSVDLERDNEEDLSFHHDGIKDFGVHDLDDPLEGKRTPVQIVMEWVFKVPVEEIAARTNTTEFEKACDWLRERLPQQEEDNRPDDNATLKTKLMQSSAEFVANFVPPDYLIDGLLQRRYVYSFTAPTGSGKTAIALLIAAHVAMGTSLAGREVEKGRVLFFAGENPDDVRARWIMLCQELKRNPDELDVVFMPFTPNISEKKIRERIDAEAAERGPFSLLIVDTSASYYTGDDENDNVALGNHARMLRTFVNLPGGPTILVTCHPTKNPNMDNLLPRGGGAFLAEVDGNLVCVKDAATMTVEVTTHGKFRGPDFPPFSFRLKADQSEKLVDSKGRKIWSIFASPISNEEVERIKQFGRDDQDEVLRVMLDQPGRSLLDYAKHLNWLTMQGEPSKQRVHRVMLKLKQNKLVEMDRDDRYMLTKKGEAEAKKTPEDPVKVVPPEHVKPSPRKPPKIMAQQSSALAAQGARNWAEEYGD